VSQADHLDKERLNHHVVWQLRTGSHAVSRDIVHWLVKFFSKEEHADQFIAGKLYLNRLAYFKELEGNDGRPDADEAVASWWQPHDVSMQLSVAQLNLTTNITSKDLAAPVSTSYLAHDYLHVYCMSAVVVPEKVTTQMSFKCTDAEIEELRKALTFDDRCFQFGGHAVVVHTASFLEQMKKAALSRRYRLRGRLVKYYDEELFHGSFKWDEIPFRKQKRFKYQREFRVCIDTGTRGSSPLLLDIGKIEHSIRVRSRELNRFFELKKHTAA
jgi:hypothetical protein